MTTPSWRSTCKSAGRAAALPRRHRPHQGQEAQGHRAHRPRGRVLRGGQDPHEQGRPQEPPRPPRRRRLRAPGEIGARAPHPRNPLSQRGETSSRPPASPRTRWIGSIFPGARPPPFLPFPPLITASPGALHASHHQCTDVKYGQRIHVLPFSDTIEASAGMRGALRRVAQAVLASRRTAPVRKGDTFLARGSASAWSSRSWRRTPRSTASWPPTRRSSARASRSTGRTRSASTRLGTLDVGGVRCPSADGADSRGASLPLRHPTLFKTIGVKWRPGDLAVQPLPVPVRRSRQGGGERDGRVLLPHQRPRDHVQARGRVRVEPAEGV